MESKENTMTHPASRWGEMLRGWVFKFIVLPFIGIAVGSIIITRIYENVFGPKAYYVHVIGDFSGQGSQIADQIWEGISKTFDPSLTTINDIPVILKRIDDKGSVENARKLSEKLAERPDTLMVIGHMTSSKSIEALPAYLQVEPPIPVILPVETNPNLLPPKIGMHRQYYPIFRISPSDRDQAKTSAEFALSKNKGAKSFWIIKDETNPTYSHFLINEFIHVLQEKKQVSVLLSSSMEIPALDVLRKFNIDCIFFTGEWSTAQILLQQIATIWTDKQPPMIIMSDSVVKESTFKGAQTKFDFYITHPMPADQYQENDGYVLYGRDIGYIVNDLLADTNLHFTEEMELESWMLYWSKWLLKMHRVTDARHVLRSVMERAAIWDNRRFVGKLGDYVFNKDGLRENARFHIWRFSKEKSNEHLSFFEEVSLELAP